MFFNAVSIASKSLSEEISSIWVEGIEEKGKEKKATEVNDGMKNKRWITVWWLKEMKKSQLRNGRYELNESESIR